MSAKKISQKMMTAEKLYTNKLLAGKRYRIHSIPVHWHDFYEFELVLAGTGTHIVNGTEYEWKMGEMHFMRLTDYHEICLNGDAMVHVISVRPSIMPTELLQKIRAIPGDLVTYLPRKEFAHVNMLCLLLEDVMAQEPLDETLAGHLLQVILTLFLRNFQREEVGAQENKSLIGAITLYIGEHFREYVSLDQLAEKFYISKNHLCFYFKKNLGKTVMTYLKDLRLEYAAKLASNTNIKSVEICEACGYGSVSNFLRDFKKKYGMSPLEMRKKNGVCH